MENAHFMASSTQGIPNRREKRDIKGISQKMLTQQLRELEKDGYINRKVYPEVPPRVEYSITKVGRTTIPIIDTLRKWGISEMKREGIDLTNK